MVLGGFISVLQKHFIVFPFNHFYAQLLESGRKSTRKQKGQIYRLLESFTTILTGTRISSQVLRLFFYHHRFFCSFKKKLLNFLVDVWILLSSFSLF